MQIRSPAADVITRYGLPGFFADAPPDFVVTGCRALCVQNLLDGLLVLITSGHLNLHRGGLETFGVLVSHNISERTEWKGLVISAFFFVEVPMAFGWDGPHGRDGVAGVFLYFCVFSYFTSPMSIMQYSCQIKQVFS